LQSEFCDDPRSGVSRLRAWPRPSTSPQKPHSAAFAIPHRYGAVSAVDEDENLYDRMQDEVMLDEVELIMLR
jgi:hypothetical protein